MKATAWRVGDAGQTIFGPKTDDGSLPATIAQRVRSKGDAQLLASAPELLASLRQLEQRVTTAARAFYGSGKASDLRTAFDGWRDEIEPIRELLARLT